MFLSQLTIEDNRRKQPLQVATTTLNNFSHHQLVTFGRRSAYGCAQLLRGDPDSSSLHAPTSQPYLPAYVRRPLIYITASAPLQGNAPGKGIVSQF